MATKGAKPRLDELFERMVTLEASDLHLKGGCAAIFRIDGQLRHSKGKTLTHTQLESLISELIGEPNMAELYGRGNVDVGHEFKGGRVRVAVFRQRGHMSLVARLVKFDIPTLEQLHLPPALGSVIEYNRGLVLMCGITGSGKSTTLACLFEMMNQKQARHILTFEDPIEFIHADNQCVFNQRELGLDFQSWPDAIRAGVRADPDVILIGEMRDEESIMLGLVAAETGHLVLGTLHTSSAAATIGRILDMFPSEKHDLIRQSLGFNLRAIICQMLVPSFKKDLGRVPAVEMMLVNAPIRKAIEEGDDARINDLILDGEKEGMQSWTKSFLGLLRSDYIDKKVAREYAPNKDALEMALRGIDISTSPLSP